MSYQSYRQRVERVLDLAKRQQMRDAAQMSTLLGCSSRTVTSIVARLRREGHQIRYDKALKRYVYDSVG